MGNSLLCSQIEILLGKTENFDELMAAAAEEREAAEAEEQGWRGLFVVSDLACSSCSNTGKCT